MMTAEKMLAQATAEFEKTFAHVKMGEAAVSFIHVDGTRQKYVEVCSGGIKEEGAAMALFDTAEKVIQSWRDALQPFKGRDYLIWRVRPEIEQDTNEKDPLRDGDFPNPTFGKWRLYSRFCAI